MKLLIGAASTPVDPLALPLAVSLMRRHSSGNSFDVNLGLVIRTGGVMRYWLGPNTLGKMGGCPIQLSFDIGVPRSKMRIILLMHSLVLGGGTPVGPGSILRNSMSHAVDRQSLCLPSLNAKINLSKAVV